MTCGEAIKATIFRYDPSRDERPRYEAIEVPYVRHMRVLDVLDYAVENNGLGAGYRWFCGVERCGLCGVSVNGKPVLACWEAAQREMVIEPLPGFPVIRDLVVDRSEFERVTLEMRPYLIRKGPYSGFPEAVTHDEMKDAYNLMTCIECYVCTAACPVLSDADHREFAGPAAFVQLARYALNPLDGLDRVPLALNGDIYACVSCYECSHVCPVGIDALEDAIEKLKRRCAAHPTRSKGGEHAKIFADLVRREGRVHPPALLLRVQGRLKAISKLGTGLRMFFRGKMRLRGRTLRRVDEVKRIFELVEGDK